MTEQGGTPTVTPRWGLGDVVVGWLLAQFGGLLMASLVLGVTGKTKFDDLSLGWVALAQTGLWAGFFVVPLVATRLKGNGIVADLGLRVHWKDLPKGVVGGAVLQYAIAAVVLVPLYWLFNQSLDDADNVAKELTDRADGAFGVTMLVLIVGIGAPIFEEIFYRGLLQRALLRRFQPRVAVTLTATAFGLSHVDNLVNEPLTVPGLIVFGLVVGVLALRTGRLGPSIAVHIGFNMTTVVALLATR